MTQAFKNPGVIIGFTRERPCLGRHADNVCLAVSGAVLEGAQAGVRSLLAQKCDALLSFGVCGGLQENLKVGDVVLASCVVQQDGTSYASDARWLARLQDRTRGLPFVQTGRLLGSDVLVPGIKAKQELGLRHNALCVDMESHIAARGAHKQGVPFMAIRAVVDEVATEIPSTLYTIIDADGSYRWGALMSVVMRPSHWGAVFSLWRHMARASASLRRVAQGALF
ncbi:MAG: squalene--hopene cyclase [Alphaproteobacteria bacterium GM202ARS2]|nr:squalene--hopene cyclase [Alphaproteobacteria bacterium GM202ARS2]